jgi:hypothetical protein
MDNQEAHDAADAEKPRKLEVYIISQTHNCQRYDTVGDWYNGHFDPSDVWIKVSQLADRREMWLVAIHELIEAALCEVAGITQQQVDDFDQEQGPWKGVHPKSTYPVGTEPGDMAEAPYYRQHQIATGIERILAAEMGVLWTEYERHIELVGQEVLMPAPADIPEDDIPF